MNPRTALRNYILSALDANFEDRIVKEFVSRQAMTMLLIMDLVDNVSDEHHIQIAMERWDDWVIA